MLYFWNDTNSVIYNCLEIYLSQCHEIHSKSHLKYFVIEPTPPLWKARHYPRKPRHEPVTLSLRVPVSNNFPVSFALLIGHMRAFSVIKWKPLSCVCWIIRRTLRKRVRIAALLINVHCSGWRKLLRGKQTLKMYPNVTQETSVSLENFLLMFKV